MDIYGHLMTPIWEVPPKWFVQNCIARPPDAERRPGDGTALTYSFSPGGRRGKGKKIPLPLDGGGSGWG